MFHPHVSYFDYHAEYIGSAAVDLVLWRDQNPEAPLQRVLVTPSLHH